MKRLTALILATILCMTITACSGGDSSSSNETTAASETEATVAEAIEETEESEESTEAEDENPTIYITMNDSIVKDDFIMTFESLEVYDTGTIPLGVNHTITSSLGEGLNRVVLRTHLENLSSKTFTNLYNAIKIMLVINDEYEYTSDTGIEMSSFDVGPLVETTVLICGDISEKLADDIQTATFIIAFNDDLSTVNYKTGDDWKSKLDADNFYAITCTLDGNISGSTSGEQQTMNGNYGEVVTLLTDQTWFYNGGSDLLVNGITFTPEGVTVKQVAFTGNGPRDNGTIEGTYNLEDNMITVLLSDGDTLEIPYTIDDETVKIGNGEYFTLDEVNEGLNGNWTCSKTSFGSKFETNLVYSSEGKAGAFVVEEANEGINLPAGQYYFSGPYNAIAMPGFGIIEVAPISEKTNYLENWGFNIIDGEVRPIHYEDVFERGSGLKGRNGYKF